MGCTVYSLFHKKVIRCPQLFMLCVCETVGFFLPGAGAAASWRAEPPAAPTSEAVEASGWPGYSATVPATGDGQQQKPRG